MSYLFSTPAQRQEMLQSIGMQSVEQLFDQIPQELQLDGPLRLPPTQSEIELERRLRELAAANGAPICFLGGGAYDHFVPAVVDEIASRGEFYTAYTPYQSEASQGSLQAFYEYQTLICQLTGMEVSNASLYEGGTAVSEAVFMAMRATNRHDKVVLLDSVHPHYRQVVQTYCSHLDCELVVVPTPGGSADPESVAATLDEQTACLVVQSPNSFGCLENLAPLCAAAKERGAFSIVSFDPISLGLLKKPGDYGVDIAVAEGQPLGIPLQYGGPYLGVLACRQQHVRRMPGRLIGQTTDRNGRRCFVLNLQAREQHIRRDKATSNICTNQGLLALRTTVYLSLLGKQGLTEVANLCCQKAHYAAKRLTGIDGLDLMFDRPFFKEFTLRCRDGAAAVARRAREAGFGIGPPLEQIAQGADPAALLVAVTESRTKDEIDRLAAALEG